MPPLKVFYTEKQAAPINRSYSPSAQKPTPVVAAWLATGVPLEVVPPRRATLTELCAAHDQAYVLAVQDGTLPNGFGNRLREVTDTLPWTVGSMLSAAEHAVRTGEWALSPTSGFHHAGWDYGAGFCTFNGLMVAALALHRQRLVERVAIVDLDQHFGDGTRDIIRRLGVEWVSHYTFGALPATRATAPSWLEVLPQMVAETIGGCDLVLYQAGVDPHVDDPLGGVLTTEQLALRDRIVFSACRAAGIPMVVNLAGGYQRPLERVVQLHVQTLLEMAGVLDGGDVCRHGAGAGIPGAEC